MLPEVAPSPPDVVPGPSLDFQRIAFELRALPLLVLMLTACGHRPAATALPDNAVGEPSPLSSDQLLVELHRRLLMLGVVQNPQVAGGDLDLQALESLTVDDFRAALGEPTMCQGTPAVPCPPDRTWLYSFYRLAEGADGGGPELLLQYYDRGVCTLAIWTQSQ